jgi:hypothetical protein
MSLSFRKHLCAPALIKTIYKEFSKIPDKVTFKRKPSISLTDHLMSGLAVFGLKCPSLLAFEKQKEETATEQNLRDLYHVNQSPSDTYLRKRLDTVDPKNLRTAFKKLFTAFQRGKGLERYEFLDGHFLLSGDGTGQFSSNKIPCSSCCQKKHRDGNISYYHQMFGVCVVHPDQRNVIPLCPELILKEDGADKNDCERNASKRFLKHFRREHPHLKGIFLADGLSSNAPNIEMLKEYDLRFILIAKPGDHRFLFEQLEVSQETIYHEVYSEDGSYHQFRFLNGICLNKSRSDIKVNMLEYRCTNKKGKEVNFSWVTDIKLNKSNVLQITRAGRARWKIENETFNTLKNLGYNFEHSYGHGKQHLSTIFCLLMMLAFLVDQIQEACCTVFQSCKQRKGTYRTLWMVMCALFQQLAIGSWENFYGLILGEKKLIMDTS